MKLITLRTIAHSRMVHSRVLEDYIHFILMYAADNILPVVPIKDLIKSDGELIIPFKIATGKKPSVSHLCVLFCLCIVQKATSHIGTKALNMRHQAQKGFRGIFVGIIQHQKGCLVYVPHTRKIISSYGVVFDDILSSALMYTSQTYAEAMAMQPAVSYIYCATSLREKLEI